VLLTTTSTILELQLCMAEHIREYLAFLRETQSIVNGCEDPRIDGVRCNGDEISTAVGSMLFAGKEKRGGMGEPVLRLLGIPPCGGHRVVKRYASGRSAEYCQN
jgi:hypothetical protein